MKKTALLFSALLIFSILAVSGCANLDSVQAKPTLLVFKMNADYTGNYSPSSVSLTFPDRMEPGWGDSVEMKREEFYTYVIDESPLEEAYFCDVPESDLESIARDLANGAVPILCENVLN